MSGATPTVSVLVPSYNKKSVIEQTLESVYAQTLQDWELIVVDDGSTDGSAELLSAHRGRATIVVGPNRGVSAARQAALERARGRYVQYLDADDLLLPDALERRVKALQHEGEVAYADFQRFVEAPGRARELGDVVAGTIADIDPDPEIACFGAFWRPPAALLYARSLSERLRWNRSLPVIQDARYLLDAALAGARFVHVPGVGALYRDEQSDSLSRRGGLSFQRDVFENAIQLQALWETRGTLSDAQKHALARCYDYVALQAFRRDPELFERCLGRFSVLSPHRPARWPRTAAALSRVLGHRATLRLLARMGKPAP